MDDVKSSPQAKKRRLDVEESADGTEQRIKQQDKEYFQCYANLDIHREMIGDVCRTFTYRKAILKNYSQLYQKAVLDAGAGTGILSLFCAEAGARKVYAVEASGVADVAQRVVSSNGVSDKITVLRGRVEEVQLPEKVDAIVSEWMGYMLLYESMLQCVLEARDKWLKDDGLMFPEKARMFIAPVADYDEYQEKVEFWKLVNDHFHIDMSCVSDIAKEQMYNFITVKYVDLQNLQSRGSCILELDLYTLKAEDLKEIKESFKCFCFGHSVIHGFVVWFSVEFPKDVMLSTSPYDPETHWQQTMLYIKPVTVHQDSEIRGVITMKPNSEHHRMLDVELEFTVDGGQQRKHFYKMNDVSS